MWWTRQRLVVTSRAAVASCLITLVIFFLPYRLGTGPAIKHIGNQTVVFERFEIRTIGSRLTAAFIPGVNDPRLTISVALIGIAMVFAVTCLMELAVRVARRVEWVTEASRVKRRLGVTSNVTVVCGLAAVMFFLVPLHVEKLPAKRIGTTGEIIIYDYYETQSFASGILWDYTPFVEDAYLTKRSVAAGIGAVAIVTVLTEVMVRLMRLIVRRS